jgi:hypothetical protein
MEESMEPSGRLVGATLFSIGAAIAAPAFGQEAVKHTVTSTYKVLVNNARVIAGESTWAPGTQDANAHDPRG